MRPTLEQTVALEARDGTRLAGTFYEPGDACHTALLINSGTGIPRRFYRRFASHAAQSGFAVLTYDYRGIGDSAPPSLRGCGVRYRDWGQRDVPSAINWLAARHPDVPLAVVGHSTGGQQLGFADNAARVRAALFVAVSTGYWAGMPRPFGWLIYGLFRFYLPLVSPVFGYAPAKKIGWGENLPIGVAREWGSWCMEPDYLAAFLDGSGRLVSLDGRAFGDVYFDRLTCPILAFGFEDDPIDTRKNVNGLMPLFTMAEVTQRWWSAEEVGVRELGHLGFFREGAGVRLWDEALSWLRAKAGST
ncbi:MAG: alpha/beta fold hydrolase [Pseudomonadota bacterium]